MRTVFVQELLRKNIYTFRGFLIPSCAHDDYALEQTVKAFAAAADATVEADHSNSFAKCIEIPIVR
jgi:hypothetical protein